MRKLDGALRNIVATLRRKIEAKFASNIVIYTCQIEYPKMTEEEVKLVVLELRKMGIVADVTSYTDEHNKVYLGWQFDKENVYTALDQNNRPPYIINPQTVG